MNTIIKATLAFSVSASILFSTITPALAVSKSSQAHEQATGWIKNFTSIDINSITSQINPANINSTKINQHIETGSVTIDQNIKQDNKGQFISQTIKTNNVSIKQEVAQSSLKQEVGQQIRGFDGTVKIGNIVLEDGPDGNKGTKPHLPCSFQIEAYGFSNATPLLSYDISAHAPSQPKGELIISGTFAIDPSKDFNGKTIVDLSSRLEGISVHHKQGAHVKVKVTYDGQVSNGYKSKVFWVKCETANTPETADPTPAVTDTNTEDGDTLSTNTSREVLGASVERGALPNTGAALVVAQAFGLFLIAVGAIASHVRRIQAKIAAQMSV